MRTVVLITGASSGIGEAIARELAQHGYALVLAARSTATLQRLAGELSRAGAPTLPVPTDVTQPEQIRRLVRQALAHFGQIDVLINNAGIGEQHASAPGSNGIADLTMHTNLLAPMQLTREVLPGMRARRTGHIINIGSVAGHLGGPNGESYAASKHGLHGFSEGLRRTLLGTGIAVSIVAPGYIRTPMTRQVRMPMAEPELIGRVVLKLLRRPRSEVVAPGIYWLPIWINALAPGLVDRAMRLTNWLLHLQPG